MLLFSSPREKDLWLWTLGVVVAIFSTLGLARTLADLLAGTGLGEALFVVGCLMVIAVVVTQGWTTRPSSQEIAGAIGISAAYMLVFVRMAVPTERSHLIEYGIVAIFVYQALLERASNGRRVPMPALLAVLIASGIGALDECIQFFLPNRVFDWQDILFNVLAALMAIVSSVVLSWLRTRSERQRPKLL